MDNFRCQHSSTFFKAAKTVMKTTKTATIAKAFRTDDPAITQPLEDFLKEHFFNPSRSSHLNPVEGECKLTVTMSDIEEATKKLSSNKAIGVD